MTEQKCGSCKWFDPFDESGTDGACLRYPPTASVVMVPMEQNNILAGQRGMSLVPQNFTAFPMLKQEQGCGEWTTRLVLQ